MSDSPMQRDQSLEPTATDLEKRLETSADELADQAEDLLQLIPTGEPLALLLEHAALSLRQVANHVAAYGFTGQRLDRLQTAAATAYVDGAGRWAEKPAFKRLAEVIRGV